MVLTATATKDMMDVFSRRTGLVFPTYILQPLNRANLFFLFMKKKGTDEVTSNRAIITFHTFFCRNH